MNMNLVTNTCCFIVVILGHFAVPESIKPHVLGMGYFGLSGALTNWLAIHMLFERVPGLYGSGIIPLKFESFKSAIYDMIMGQFFTMETVQRFVEEESAVTLDFEPVIEKLDYDKIFDGFLEIVQKSKFGGMLALVGGTSALESMREPFAGQLKIKLKEITESEAFAELLSRGPEKTIAQDAQQKISEMVNHRLEELTPDMVKQIVQDMIRSHLGWLVVWGGVFGALIGLIASFMPSTW